MGVRAGTAVLRRKVACKVVGVPWLPYRTARNRTPAHSRGLSRASGAASERLPPGGDSERV